MADAPQYKKGSTAAEPGQGQPLPQGGAAEVNAQAAAIPPAANPQTAPAPAPESPPPPEGSGATGAAEEPGGLDHLSAALDKTVNQAPVDYKPQTEAEQFLFGGEGEGGGQPTPRALSAGPLKVPQRVLEGLPALQMAANMPGASPQVKALFSYVTYHLNRSRGA